MASSSDHTARLVALASGKVAPTVGFAEVYSHATALPKALFSSLWMRETVWAVIFDKAEVHGVE